MELKKFAAPVRRNIQNMVVPKAIVLMYAEKKTGTRSLKLQRASNASHDNARINTRRFARDLHGGRELRNNVRVVGNSRDDCQHRTRTKARANSRTRFGTDTKYSLHVGGSGNLRFFSAACKIKRTK